MFNKTDEWSFELVVSIINTTVYCDMSNAHNMNIISTY